MWEIQEWRGGKEKKKKEETRVKGKVMGRKDETAA